MLLPKTDYDTSAPLIQTLKNGFARKSDLIKVLGRGKLKAKVNVTAHYFSATAEKAVEKAGGKIKKLINE